MSFDCKECGRDITATQAKETYEEFERALCAECFEMWMRRRESV